MILSTATLYAGLRVPTTQQEISALLRDHEERRSDLTFEIGRSQSDLSVAQSRDSNFS
jgi:hypothetical protein